METTLEEIEKLHIDWERGFYLEFRRGRIHGGRKPVEKPVEGVEVFEV